MNNKNKYNKTNILGKKTNHPEEVKELIERLTLLSKLDLSDQAVRFNCESIMCGTFSAISSPDEKAFSHWILNKGGELGSQTVLEKEHPSYDEDIVEFKNKLESIIDYLKDKIPDGYLDLHDDQLY